MAKSLPSEPSFLEIVCYPYTVGDMDAARACLSRIRDLARLGIRYLYLWGDLKIGKAKVLGKGFSSIVVLCSDGKVLGACKVLRLDSRRQSLKDEARILALLGPLGVAPRLYGYTDNVIFMEYVEGVRLVDYLDCGADRTSTLKVLRNSLEAAGIMDELGVDHGELSRPARHLLVRRSLATTFIDFESASTKRRPRNVSSLASALFLSNTELARKVMRVLGEALHLRIRVCLRDLLGRYKRREVSYRDLLSCIEESS